MKVFLIISILFSMNSCVNFSENNITKSILSPDEEYVAIAFIRSVGVTTGFSPQVSILTKNRKLPNKAGNIFIGDDSKYIDISWQNSKTLVIYHNCEEDKIFKKIHEFKDIKIKYVKILNEDVEKWKNWW